MPAVSAVAGRNPSEMCMFGGSPSMPQPAAVPDALPPPPTAIDPAVLMAKQNARLNAATRRGRTVATSPQGLIGPANDELKLTTGT